MVFSSEPLVQLVVRDARGRIHATQPTYIPSSLHVTAGYSLWLETGSTLLGRGMRLLNEPAVLSAAPSRDVGYTVVTGQIHCFSLGSSTFLCRTLIAVETVIPLAQTLVKFLTLKF